MTSKLSSRKEGRVNSLPTKEVVDHKDCQPKDNNHNNDQPRLVLKEISPEGSIQYRSGQEINLNIEPNEDQISSLETNELSREDQSKNKEKPLSKTEKLKQDIDFIVEQRKVGTSFLEIAGLEEERLGIKVSSETIRKLANSHPKLRKIPKSRTTQDQRLQQNHSLIERMVRAKYTPTKIARQLDFAVSRQRVANFIEEDPVLSKIYDEILQEAALMKVRTETEMNAAIKLLEDNEGLILTKLQAGVEPQEIVELLESKVDAKGIKIGSKTMEGFIKANHQLHLAWIRQTPKPSPLNQPFWWKK